jgi:copper(I)-binding protein
MRRSRKSAEKGERNAMKSAILASAALALGSFGLAACGEEATAEAEPSDTAPEGISVTDGRLILPAVGGNPGAVYFTVHNDGERDSFIRAASVEGARSAVLHQTSAMNGEPSMDEIFQTPVPGGSELKFEPGGLHVMAGGLAETLAAGGNTEVTLTFIGGKTATFPVEIRAAGDER